MRRFLPRLAALLTAAALPLSATAQLLATPSATAAPHEAKQGMPTISVKLGVGKQLIGIDPPLVPAEVSVTADDCSAGCELHKYGYLRFNEAERDLGKRTYPAGAPRTWVVHDKGEYIGDQLLEYTWYLIRGYHLSSLRENTPWYGGSGAWTFSDGWHQDFQPQSTETMIMRSDTRGQIATLAPDTRARSVGIVSAKGPQNGVMRVSVDGVVKATVDLKATRWTPRVIVAAVDVPAGAKVQVTNITPTARAGKDVHIDGIAVHVSARTMLKSISASQEPQTLRSPKQSGPAKLTVAFAPDQRRTPEGKVALLVTATAPDCLTTCSIVREEWDNGEGDGDPVETTILRRTSSTATPQTLEVVDVPTGASVDYYLAGPYIAGGIYPHVPQLHSQRWFDTSDGWAEEAQGASTEGTILRTPVRGAGATTRLHYLSGRTVGLVSAYGPNNGVMRIWVDGVPIRTVDMYAPKWRPKQVVATLDLPPQGRLSISNVTPSDRAGSDIHIDGLTLLDDWNDWY